jgi:hypothetical protein
MPRLFADNILEKSNTIGTASYTLEGAPPGYRSFASGFVSTDTPYYVVRNRLDTKYEFNRGGVFTAPSTLTRSVFLSSNTNAAVAWTTDDMPLSVYCPRSADIDEGHSTLWLGAARNSLVRGGFWVKTNTPSAGYQQINFFDGTADVPFMNINTTTHIAQLTAEGGLGIPQNIQAGNYTLVATDASKQIYHALGAGAAAYTIPANATVAFPIGTTITFINDSATAITIVITATDVMAWSAAGTTGTRTLAQYGVATAIKVTTTRWLISGTGLS